MLQETALKILQSGQNVFLTGSAGTGKTYLLNKYIAGLRAHDVALAITASTGIAATHIGGQTIHSWSGLGIKDVITEHDLEKIAKKKAVRKRLEDVKVLIIDEISMLSRQNLENINTILQYFKVSWEPFGGIQVIFSGDFFQLPPVSKERLPNSEKFAFMAPIWRKANLKICYLTEQFRQSDNSLTDFLNEIRSGEISDSGYDSLRECMENAQHEVEATVKLFTHNADVDLINAQELLKLDTPTETFYATTTGSKTLLTTLKKSVLALDTLMLKEGAQVIFVKNNYEAGYLNGTMGTITGFSSDGWPIVTTHDHEEIIATPVDWAITDEFGKPAAQFSQIPLRLAWAITVHKSQGMTLDAAEMDLSKTFEPGQGYVALSRVKSWSGLRLLGCNHNALQLDPLALKADQRFQELSAEAEVEFADIDEKKSAENFRTFCLKNGGSRDPDLTKNTTPKKSAKLAEPKVSTYAVTKALVEEGKTLVQIMQARSMSEDTIINHLESLKKDHPDLNLDQFKPAPDRLAEMLTGFQTIKSQNKKTDLSPEGKIKLRPAFDLLNEKYFYRELKLARLFFEG